MDRRKALAAIRATDERGNAIPVDILYCTLDMKRKRGGDLVRLKRVVPTGAMDVKNAIIRFRFIDPKKHARKHVYPVHLPLLLEVNGTTLW
jgi:hypothetical protein